MRGAEGGVYGGLGQRVGDGRPREWCPLLSSLMTSQTLAYVRGVSSGSAVELYRMCTILQGQGPIAALRSSHFAVVRSSGFALLGLSFLRETQQVLGAGFSGCGWLWKKS